MPVATCQQVDWVRAHYLVECLADDAGLPASQALWQRLADACAAMHAHLGCRFCRPETLAPARPPAPPPCGEEGCLRPRRGAELCALHTTAHRPEAVAFVDLQTRRPAARS
jgi:hypothetical protein